MRHRASIVPRAVASSPAPLTLMLLALREFPGFTNLGRLLDFHRELHPGIDYSDTHPRCSRPPGTGEAHRARDADVDCPTQVYDFFFRYWIFLELTSFKRRHVYRSGISGGC